MLIYLTVFMDKTMYICTYIYIFTSVDVVPLMKTARVVVNSGHCVYSIGLKCF